VPDGAKGFGDALRGRRSRAVIGYGICDIFADTSENPAAESTDASLRAKAGERELHDVRRDLSGSVPLIRPDPEGALEDQR